LLKIIKKPRLIAGFTLIELLIVVAIIAILAAVGIPMYNGYIADSKQQTAQNNLRSIALMEADWFSERNEYYEVGNSAASTGLINTNLFNGRQTLDVSNDRDYSYFIRRLTISGNRLYESVAVPMEPGLIRYCLTETNVMTTGNNCN